jgi:alkylation response protein AidB-like acyl-CoA dehydrogenase
MDVRFTDPQQLVDRAVRSAETSVRIHDVYGSVEDDPAGTCVCNLTLTAMHEGPSEIQRIVVPRPVACRASLNR